MVVYFNNWFSSISPVIKDLKNRHSDLKIIGSSHNKNHVMAEVVDEFYVEPFDDTVSTEEWLSWLKKFLLEQCVDVFFVKKWTREVLSIKDKLEAMGVHVVAESPDLWDLLDDKAATYKEIADKTGLSGSIRLPEYINTDSATEVISFISDKDACFKLNTGEGGSSYKRIMDPPKSLKELEFGRYNQVTKEELVNILQMSQPDEIKKFLFMEYLDSPEISIDCYRSREGFISVCRSKVGGTRAERIFHDNKFNRACEIIWDIFRFEHPFNVQFRLKKWTDASEFENYRLLEINPRISGGLYYQIPLGLNICDAYICDLLYEPHPYPHKEHFFPPYSYKLRDYLRFPETIVSHVETAVLMDI